MFHPSQSLDIHIREKKTHLNAIEEVAVLEYLFVTTKPDDVIFSTYTCCQSLVFLNYSSSFISSFFFSISLFFHIFFFSPIPSENYFVSRNFPILIPIITKISKKRTVSNMGKKKKKISHETLYLFSGPYFGISIFFYRIIFENYFQ